MIAKRKKDITEERNGNWFFQSEWLPGTRKKFDFVQTCYYGTRGQIDPDISVFADDLMRYYGEYSTRVAELAKQFAWDLYNLDLLPVSAAKTLLYNYSISPALGADLARILREFGNYVVIHAENGAEKGYIPIGDGDICLDRSSKHNAGMPVKEFLLMRHSKPITPEFIEEWSGISIDDQNDAYQAIIHYLREIIAGDHAAERMWSKV